MTQLCLPLSQPRKRIAFGFEQLQTENTKNWISEVFFQNSIGKRPFVLPSAAFLQLSCMVTERFNPQAVPEKSPASIAGRKLFEELNLNYAENDVPQPQPPVAFGFSNVKPEPIMFEV